MALESMENTVLRRVSKDLFQQDQLPVFEIDKADYVLNFGADFLSTWLSPVQYSRAYGHFRQGRDHRGTLVQLEPRMSMTAANADKWHYLNPGTEGTGGPQHCLRAHVGLCRTGWTPLRSTL